MIRRLRDRHRWVVPLIAVLTALAFAVALAGRQPRADRPIPGPLRSHAEQP